MTVHPGDEQPIPGMTLYELQWQSKTATADPEPDAGQRVVICARRVVGHDSSAIPGVVVVKRPQRHPLRNVPVFGCEGQRPGISLEDDALRIAREGDLHIPRRAGCEGHGVVGIFAFVDDERGLARHDSRFIVVGHRDLEPDDEHAVVASARRDMGYDNCAIAGVIIVNRPERHRLGDVPVCRRKGQSLGVSLDDDVVRVARDRLEALSGQSPFLTTREFFQLKSDPDLYARYADAEPAAQRELLAGLSDRPLPRADQVLRPPQPHAEWRISTRTLCAWMEKVAGLELTQINAGPLDTSLWRRVSFKGGSELGVLNLTTSVRDRDGREFCVSATWNATQTFDAEPLLERYATLILRLSDRPR